MKKGCPYKSWDSLFSNHAILDVSTFVATHMPLIICPNPTKCVLQYGLYLNHI